LDAEKQAAKANPAKQKQEGKEMAAEQKGENVGEFSHQSIACAMHLIMAG
jgi:hypothetical protein